MWALFAERVSLSAQPVRISISLLKGDAALRARLWLTLRAVMLVVAF